MAYDLETRFHEAWLGMVQPVEGLVVSIPVLVETQTMERHGPALQEQLQELCPVGDDGKRRVRDLGKLLEKLLGWTPDLYDRGDALPSNLSRYIAEGHQTIRPTLALRKAVADEAPVARVVAAVASEDVEEGGGEEDEENEEEEDVPPRPSGRSLSGIPDIETPESLAGKPYVVLVWELPSGLALDKPETETGDWRYPPSSKFDRLLRACRVPIGLLTNGEVIRLVYAPHGEASGAITFDLTDMGDVGGRPILDAFVMLLSSHRLFGVRSEDALPTLLRRSRERQANVTNALAAQVFDALDNLLRGFEAASRRDRDADLAALLRRDDADDPEEDRLYGALLTVLLRLVFILYAEDRELLPTSNETYAKSLSVGQLFEDLRRDQGAFPDTMSRRFGAWSRLLALFRTIYDGVEHGALHIPRRRGELFDPARFPFLERWSDDDAVPTIDDETVYGVLERLMILEGQRLSYKVLSVEQIGSVYEALMGYGVVQLGSAAVCCRHKSLQTGGTGGVWIEARAILDESPASRGKFLTATYDVVKGDATKIAGDLKAAKDEAAVLDALDRISLKKVKRRSKGQVVLQPGEERRRTSSHYTPRSLSEPIVRRTLEPLISAMSDKGEPSSRQLLSLKVCDPAMGSGAFLVGACRFLGDHVVAAWEREGQTDKIASAKEDVVNHARRLVAQTCLYGVDKNPFAVSLAKLSLWLETLAKDEPFTFVDHCLKHGDSLVGLSFEQIRAFHWAPKAQMELIERELSSAIAESLELRQQILDLAGDSSPGVARLKEQLLWDANDAQERVRIVGDLVVGAFFEKPKKEREAERRARLDEVRTWLVDGGEPPSTLTEMRKRIRSRMPIFHWELEFPEVFHRGRPDPLHEAENQTALADAFVGNPPFLGGSSISTRLGGAYRDWLLTIHTPSHGNADLSAHFFRLAEKLLGANGTVGMIATNTIGQGDTRASGLQYLVGAGCGVYDATTSLLWPGAAAVSVSVVHIGRGAPTRGVRTRHNGREVGKISSRLRAGAERADPERLQVNRSKAFGGIKIYGMGFLLTPQERSELINDDPRNAECIYPYLGGAEINSSPTQSFYRYVINFADMELAEARRWPTLLRIVEERVKPERDARDHNEIARRQKELWWRFRSHNPELYTALEGKARCLVTARVTKHLCFSFQSTDQVFNEKVYAFALDSYAAFSLLQSRVHESWTRLLSSTLKNDLNYSASDCFETFPFPNETALCKAGTLEDLGEKLYDVRAKLMIDRKQGLTTTYNQLKDPAVVDAPIEALRELHVSMDCAALATYGWQDIKVPPFTTPVTDAEWKAKEAFEDEVIDRMFALNAERAKEEKLLGAGASGANGKSGAAKKAAATRKKRAAAGQLELGAKPAGKKR